MRYSNCDRIAVKSKLDVAKPSEKHHRNDTTLEYFSIYFASLATLPRISARSFIKITNCNLNIVKNDLITFGGVRLGNLCFERLIEARVCF